LAIELAAARVRVLAPGQIAAGLAYVLAMAGTALVVGRAIDAGCRLLEQAVEVCKTHELVFQLPSIHTTLGVWLVWAGELDRARRRARRGLELARQVGRPAFEALGLAGLGAAAVLQGDRDSAQDHLSEGHAVMQRNGLRETSQDLYVCEWLALSACASGDLETARAEAESKVRVGRGGGSRRHEAVGEWLLGVAAQVEERHGQARTHLEASRTLSTDPRVPLPLGRSLLGLAQLAVQHGDLDKPWELAHDSLEVLDDYGDRVGAAAALETLADLAVDHDDPERSLRLLAASQRFHTDTGIVRFPLEARHFDPGAGAPRIGHQHPLPHRQRAARGRPRPQRTDTRDPRRRARRPADPP
jgi:hypothetical protein